MSRAISLLCLLLVVSISCERSQPVVRTISLATTALWGAFDDSVATGGGLIADFVILSDGQITAMDYQGDRILRYDPTGAFLGAIGREGSGPLEFRRPSEIEIQGDTLYVRDTGNNRIVLIDPGNEYLHTVTLNPARMIPTSFSVGPGGWIYGATHGYTPDGLLVVWAPDGRQIRVLGELQHEATMIFDGELVIETALRGGVAPFLHNWASACATTDGGVILLFMAQARAIKFSKSWEVVWNYALSFSEYEDVFSAYVEANRRSNRGEVLSLWRDTVADETGGCWLLLNIDAPLTVYHLTAEGNLSERYIGPDFSANRIYPHDGDIWAYDISIEMFLRLSPTSTP